jgi:uncharacterized protein YbjQ (UPF0145 family)
MIRTTTNTLEGREIEEYLGVVIGEAVILGANAVIGIDIDYEVVGQNGGMMMVSVSGTAVKVKPKQ